MSDTDFYQLVKFVRDEPEFDEDRLQYYLDQGMWPDNHGKILVSSMIEIMLWSRKS
jgi:hypothetical protein